jgi:DNA-binding transcriptional regulator LsrR (DeoR family)
MAARPPSRRRRPATAAPVPRKHLPHLLREIADVFGEPMAAKLAHAFGGRYVYLPKRALPSHPIAKATSVGLLAWLIQHHDECERIIVPCGRALLVSDRVAQAKTLPDAGLTVAAIASRVRVHVRTIHTYLRLARERGL